MDRLKQYYMTIFSSVFSPCGNFISVGNNRGKIAVFNLGPFLQDDNNFQPQEEQKYPFFKFQAHADAIYSMVSTKALVISGSVGEISSWSWSCLKRKVSKPVWTLKIPQEKLLTQTEVNSLAVSVKDNETRLFAGCGDNCIYCFDIDAESLLFTLSGHTEYIHCIALGNENCECASASEDGSVRIWDARKGGGEVHIIEPFKHQLATRPQFGKWIGCVSFDENDDWLACGGAPALCIWHLRTLSPATQFVKPDATTNVVQFYDDTVISGGSEACINHWTFSGELFSEVPTSASSVYGISINSNPAQRVLSAVGSSYQIDICKDFKIRDFSFIFS